MKINRDYYLNELISSKNNGLVNSLTKSFSDFVMSLKKFRYRKSRQEFYS